MLGRRELLSLTAGGLLVARRAAAQAAGRREVPTIAIANFAVNARYEALSPKAIEWAKTAALDCLGVAVAGSREESSQIVARMAREESGAQEATVIGHGFKSSAAHAAFVNGISAHGTDFDHSFVVGGQPTAPIIPALFALAETTGAPGKQVIEAYAAGFEVAAHLALAGQGNSAIPVPGVFGATAACGKLLGLNEEQMEMALGIASATVSGSGITQGTMGKPLGVGLAARSGVQAAKMAKAGFTAGEPSLPVVNDLGKVSALETYGVRLKPFPCGGLTHTAIFAAIQLRNEHSISPDMVDRILVEVPQGTANTIMYRIPETGLQGKFSMGYLVARGLADGKLGLDAFSDEAVRDEKVLRLVRKTEMKVDPNLPPSTSADGSRAATLTITLTNGQTHRRNERFPKGSPQVPMSRAELEDKVRACTRGVIRDASCDQAIEQISRLETLPNVRSIAGLLSG